MTVACNKCGMLWNYDKDGKPIVCDATVVAIFDTLPDCEHCAGANEISLLLEIKELLLELKNSL